jgi:wobble nucleotide-excising tRNase
MTKFWEIMRWDYDPTISAYLEEKDNNDKTIKKLSKEISEIESKIKEQNDIILEAQKNTTNIEEAISNINNELIYIGIDTFSITKHNSTNQSNPLYKIKRNKNEDNKDCEFQTLSEGEKMIISFLYFCEKCKGKKTAASQSTKKIVVIDDPISSLSHIWIFNVGQLIRNEFFKSENYEQILDLQDLIVENHIDFTTDFKNCSKNFWGAGQFSFQTFKQNLQAFYKSIFRAKV